MMVSAMVLVNTNVGEEAEVLERLKRVEGVEEAHALWGVYDLMVKVRAGSSDRLKEIVRSNLRQPGVNTLLTLLTADGVYSKPEV
jgi:DNA-binding Lrp family transcriptional regulator